MNLRKLPGDFDSLVRLHPPAAIHDEVADGNAIGLVNKLTAVPNPTEGQLKYLDTLTILVERYEDQRPRAEKSAYQNPGQALLRQPRHAAGLKRY